MSWQVADGGYVASQTGLGMEMRWKLNAGRGSRGQTETEMGRDEGGKEGGREGPVLWFGWVSGFWMGLWDCDLEV